eukprot:scaffold1.g5513.t1
MSLGKALSDPPTDGITGLGFCGDTSLLLASSWDGTVRIYDAAADRLNGTFVHGAPVLDATFEGEGVIYSGGLDGTVKRYDFFAGQETLLGQHAAAARCVGWLPGRGLLASGGWDATLRVWDPRAPAGAPVATVQLPGKAYSMSASDARLVVGTSGRQEEQARKYAFKCHRRSEGGRDTVYPVNAISFNKAWGTFATGGGDGVVNIWDGANKKRLHQARCAAWRGARAKGAGGADGRARISGYPTSVAALAFDAAGSLLAVAASYTHEQGEREHPADAIYVRPCAEAEVRPKARGAAAGAPA